MVHRKLKEIFIMTTEFKQRDDGVIEVRNAKITFRNFEGREAKYNNRGSKNFVIVIEDENVANKLSSEGWNVKPFSTPNDDGKFNYKWPVAVSFSKRPPKIVKVINNKQFIMDEESIKDLDYAVLDRVDVAINPYHWTKDDGSTGIKAYLKTLYVTIRPEDFEEDYRIDESEDDLPF